MANTKCPYCGMPVKENTKIKIVDDYCYHLQVFLAAREKYNYNDSTSYITLGEDDDK